MTFDRKGYISKSKRIVIKIGSSLLTDSKKMGIRARFLNQMAEQVKKLTDSGLQCVIVTSGAIAAGMFELGLGKRPKEMAKLQALAAVGQSSLMHQYKTAFKRRGLKVAQILLTREDLSNRGRYSNAHNTFMELFDNGIIPIVNENDSVAVEEIKFGGNDTLGVLVAHLCESDLLVLLTDTDGFFNEDPRLNPRAELISEVVKLDPQMEKSASLSQSVVGTGGMQTKIQAAKSMMRSGIPMVIANGNTPSVLNRILNSEKIGTFFQPSTQKMPSRKRWLAWSVNPKGAIIVDEGAKAALIHKDKSLLPTGIKMLSGIWEKGEVVKISDADGKEIARGISNYSSRELELIKGMKTSEISKRLGHVAADEVVHRDNLVKI
ncbi:MAG TPA: glutamate 5-kinase [bacterium]|jgi:glutamate 5-kinase|nr:glutamate 5-kinase [bacterium]